MPTEPAPLPVPGAVRASLVRQPVRVRGATVTTAGWRLDLTSPQGPGAILVVEGPVASWYRGEGVCLGLTQEKLAALWTGLAPQEESEPEMQQWG
jgi:hypothetical protein